MESNSRKPSTEPAPARSPKAPAELAADISQPPSFARPRSPLVPLTAPQGRRPAAVLQFPAAVQSAPPARPPIATLEHFGPASVRVAEIVHATPLLDHQASILRACPTSSPL